MIVSSCEIQRVLFLVHLGPFQSIADIQEHVTDGLLPYPSAPPARPHRECAALPGQDRGWRSIRVLDIRRQLASGRYAITPDIVADKIIGRALCDQVSRLYDR